MEGRLQPAVLGAGLSAASGLTEGFVRPEHVGAHQACPVGTVCGSTSGVNSPTVCMYINCSFDGLGVLVV